MHNSRELYTEALKYIPGGVNSPVRACKSVGTSPLYISKGKGSRIYDVEGNSYLDLVCSWGPLILGHADSRILDKLGEYAARGTSFGANTELELQFAKQITSLYASIDMLRMVNSGTEATMSAIRLARGYTGKDKFIKFAGCYHGHGDSFLIKAGSGVLTLGIPGSPGITAGTAGDTLVARFNDLDSVKQLLTAHKGKIAAVILEPVMGNAGVIPPEPGFLEGLRNLTKSEEILLIFDEVITGFRLGLDGGQGLYGLEPDLTCLGKIIGGGLPVGAFGGKQEIMAYLAPEGPVYQAGTLSGNPVALGIGFETIKILASGAVYPTLEIKAARLAEGFRANLQELDLHFSLNRVASMFSLFFTRDTVSDFESASTSQTEFYTFYYKEMLKRGIYMAPSPFEASFLSLAHSDEDIETIIGANYESLKELKKKL